MIHLNLIASTCKREELSDIHEYLFHKITRSEIHGYENNYITFIDYVHILMNIKKIHHNQRNSSAYLYVYKEVYFSKIRGIESDVRMNNNYVESLALGYACDIQLKEGKNNIYSDQIMKLIQEEASILYEANMYNTAIADGYYKDKPEDIEKLIIESVQLQFRADVVQIKELLLCYLLGRKNKIPLFAYKKKRYIEIWKLVDEIASFIDEFLMLERPRLNVLKIQKIILELQKKGSAKLFNLKELEKEFAQICIDATKIAAGDYTKYERSHEQKIISIQEERQFKKEKIWYNTI